MSEAPFAVPYCTYTDGRPEATEPELLHHLTQHGACLVRGVPPTSERMFDFVAMLGGSELGMDEELSGPAVMRLRYDEAKARATDRPAYFTRDEFPLHSDLTYVDNPPRWLLTLCVTPADRGGDTLVAPCEPAWHALTVHARSQLERRVYAFANAPNTGEGVCVDRAIHEADGMRKLWRFRLDTLICPPDCAAAVASFTQALQERHHRLALRTGDLLVIDNHRVVHGRTDFATPSRRNMLRSYASDAKH